MKNFFLSSLRTAVKAHVLIWFVPGIWNTSAAVIITGILLMRRILMAIVFEVGGEITLSAV